MEILHGAPGVYSARYAGPHRSSEDNIDLLLRNLAKRKKPECSVRTVIALVGIEEKPLLFEGIISGTIITERKGSSGFGYDPVFVPRGHNKTFAEMDLAEKNSMSHRAIAVRKLERYLNHSLLSDQK